MNYKSFLFMNLQTAIRFRPITFLDEKEAGAMLEQLSREYRKSTIIQQHVQPNPKVNASGVDLRSGNINLPTLNITPSNKALHDHLDSKRSTNGEHNDSFIKGYNKRTGISNIKDDYLHLWYQKLALEEMVSQLAEQNQRRD